MAQKPVGVLFEISADPSKAEQALAEFQRNVAGFTQNLQAQFSPVAEALTGLGQTATISFGKLSEGMTANTSLAGAFSKSIEEAMARSLKATVGSIGSESIVQALRSLGLAFYLLAVGDFAGSANAFESAAIWGTIGGVAAGLQGSLGGAAAASHTSRGTSRRGQGAGLATFAGVPVSLAPGSASRPAGGAVNVLVMGQPQAAQWLTEVINTGVEQYDLKLTASHTKRPASAAH